MPQAMSLGELLALLRRLGAEPEARGDADPRLIGITSDSRNVGKGDVFVALATPRGHGLEYLETALGNGAAAVLWEPVADADWSAFVAARCRWVPAVRVDALSRHFGAIAAAWFGDPSARLPVIAVTGTDGKTSVSQIVAAAMNRAGRRYAVLGTIGNGFPGALVPSTKTTLDPVSLQAAMAGLADAGAAGFAMEASSHGLDQGRLDGMHLRGAVLTNLSRDHLDYHGSVAAYADAKRRLFHHPGLGFAVLNADDAFGRELLAANLGEVRKIAYGRAADADLRIVAIEPGDAGLCVTLAEAGREQVIASRLMGDFNALNLAAAYAVLRELGVDATTAAAALAEVRPVAGRMEASRLPGGVAAVVDYAHTPAALEHALRALRAHCRGSLVCVFGCGGERDRGKRPLMGAAAERFADRVVVTDDNPRSEDPVAIVAEILGGVTRPERIVVERDRARAIRGAIAEAGDGDVVLIAGKGHEDYQVVGTRRSWFSDRALVAQIARELASESAAAGDATDSGKGSGGAA